MSLEELKTWKYDHVADSLATYADPSIEFDLIEQETDGSVHVKENWQPGDVFSVEDAIFRYTEIFEFAARLAMTKAENQSREVE